MPSTKSITSAELAAKYLAHRERLQATYGPKFLLSMPPGYSDDADVNRFETHSSTDDAKFLLQLRNLYRNYLEVLFLLRPKPFNHKGSRCIAGQAWSFLQAIGRMSLNKHLVQPDWGVLTEVWEKEVLILWRKDATDKGPSESLWSGVREITRAEEVEDKEMMGWVWSVVWGFLEEGLRLALEYPENQVIKAKWGTFGTGLDVSSAGDGSASTVGDSEKGSVNSTSTASNGISPKDWEESGTASKGTGLGSTTPSMDDHPPNGIPQGPIPTLQWDRRSDITNPVRFSAFTLDTESANSLASEIFGSMGPVLDSPHLSDEEKEEIVEEGVDKLMEETRRRKLGLRSELADEEARSGTERSGVASTGFETGLLL